MAGSINWPHTCPKCVSLGKSNPTTANSKGEAEEKFGFRDEHAKTKVQSWCRDCRKKYS